MELSKQIKKYRTEANLSQEELADKIYVSRQTISNWETGYTPIPLNKLVRFANLYNYSLDFIVGFTRDNIKYNKNIKLDSKLIGKNLKAIRENLKLTQQQIADKCNIYQSTYNHYETGYSLIKIIPAYSICKTYNISFDWLVGRTNNIKINK